MAQGNTRLEQMTDRYSWPRYCYWDQWPPGPLWPREVNQGVCDSPLEQGVTLLCVF